MYIYQSGFEYSSLAGYRNSLFLVGGRSKVHEKTTSIVALSELTVIQINIRTGGYMEGQRNL